jgi:hypothetical protein
MALGPGRYLLGVLELLWLAGFAGLGAVALRRRAVAELDGAAAVLAALVLGSALLVLVAEVLGTVSLFEPVPYLVGVAAVGLGLWWWGRAAHRDPLDGARQSEPRRDGPGSGLLNWVALGALAVAAVALIHFAGGVRTRLGTGMTGFDSTWYHGPFAAGFFQSGNTIDLHFIAPQFLAWFYPANGEIFHAVGMLAFGRDVVSPFLNLGWFAACLLAAWCVGRPYRVGPWSLALAAVALSVPALSDQAGEARNDVVGIFFLLAAVAIAVNAWAGKREEGLSTGTLLLTGLAAGLAAGTKLNFLLPGAVIVVGLAFVAPAGARLRTPGLSLLGALVGGGYWYLRNLVHTGNPLPWVRHLGPISLPAPGQGLGGREAHSVASYLTDGSVWSGWFLPGLHHGLWIVWPLLGLAALAGLLLALRANRLLAVAGAAGLAAALAWLVSPTSASGPDGMPHGFESGLRYLTPALILGLALLPTSPPLRRLLQRQPAAPQPGARSSFFPLTGEKDERGRAALGIAALVVVLAALVGYPLQRRYLEDRYANPSFTTPGLDAAFKWARGVSGARIATTSTRQYPLFGADLSNRVDFVGVERPHGGFEAVGSCQAWRQALDAGNYDYVVATFDRVEAGAPPFPPQALWTEGPGAKVVLRRSPTVVFRLTAPPDPTTCPS